MPYNNTPIAPSNEVNGSVALPLARVQKIIAADPDRLHVSKNASFAIALATEMFIQHLATTTHNVVKAERKPRRNIQYRDVATAVAKTDNLEFLVDVVPRTMQYKEFKKKQEQAAKEKEKEKEKKQNEANLRAMNGTAHADGKEGDKEGEHADVAETEQNGHTQNPEGEPEAMQVDDREEIQPTPEVVKEPEPEDDDEEDPAAMQIEMEMRGPRANGASPVLERRSGGFTAINGGR